MRTWLRRLVFVGLILSLLLSAQSLLGGYAHVTCKITCTSANGSSVNKTCAAALETDEGSSSCYVYSDGSGFLFGGDRYCDANCTGALQDAEECTWVNQ